jgi:hypothetical protein
MKINGLIKNPKWKDFYKHDDKNINCKHCKYQTAENSIPKKDFQTATVDKNKKISMRIVKEVTIVRGSDEDIIGFNF